MLPTILIVDDERHTRDGLRLSLEDSFDVYTAADRTQALEVLRDGDVEVLVTDLRLGGDDGMKLLEDAHKLKRPPVCIMMTAYGSVDTAVEAMKRGAWHFVTKPLNLDELELLIKRAVRSRSVEKENEVLRAKVEEHEVRSGVASLIGSSRALQHVAEIIRQIAPSEVSVLIEGESGTGKELAARAIHQLSGRPKDKLVVVNCAALSPQILESELFGHEKGAFTGATERRIGRFELAHGGTLVLDEIGEIDASTQVKLLRALGEKTIERVGGNKTIEVNARVVAATNRSLAGMVAEGKFREDLFYRLRVIHFTMPPLRERKEDIIPIAQSFLKTIAETNRKPYRDLSPEALQTLLDYDWPGNVRELRAAIEHGVVMCNTAQIMPRHLPESVRTRTGLRLLTNGSGSGGDKTAGASHGSPAGKTDDLNLEQMERRLIQQALQRTRENRTEAAKVLGISRRTLQRKLKEFGLAE